MMNIQTVFDIARELAWPSHAPLPRKLIHAGVTATFLAYAGISGIASYKMGECILTGYEDQNECQIAREILDGQNSMIPILGSP